MPSPFKTRLDFFEATVTRFWSNVEKRGPDDCWHWQGTLAMPNNSGQRYGYFGLSVNGKAVNYRAHRFSWMLINGSIPDGMVIMHTCDVPACVNPAHLRCGSHYDNAQDRTQKWRTDQGRKHYAAKLTPDQVLEIFDNKTDPHEALARRYGVHGTHILQIRRGRKWKRLLHRTGRINDPRGDPTLVHDEQENQNG